MRPEDEALHDRLKSLLDSNSRVQTDLAAKRLSMDTDELVDRVKGMRNQYKLIVDGNRIVDSISAYKQSWLKARDSIPASELNVLDGFRERVGSQFVEDGMIAGYQISGGHVIALKLSGLGLDALPDPVLDLPSLENLDVSNNQLTTLPNGFKRLERMRHLDIGNNQLTMLPRDFTRLEHLERLDATCNMLSPLPETICGIAGLKRLDVSNNKLTMLPDAIGQLKALVELRAAGNYLSRLPDCLGTLHALEVFDLENNFINVLPPCIENLQKGALKQLNLAGNPMRGSGENREPWD